MLHRVHCIRPSSNSALAEITDRIVMSSAIEVSTVDLLTLEPGTTVHVRTWDVRRIYHTWIDLVVTKNVSEWGLPRTLRGIAVVVDRPRLLNEAVFVPDIPGMSKVDRFISVGSAFQLGTPDEDVSSTTPEIWRSGEVRSISIF